MPNLRRRTANRRRELIECIRFYIIEIKSVSSYLVKRFRTSVCESAYVRMSAVWRSVKPHIKSMREATFW